MFEQILLQAQMQQFRGEEDDDPTRAPEYTPNFQSLFSSTICSSPSAPTESIVPQTLSAEGLEASGARKTPSQNPSPRALSVGSTTSQPIVLDGQSSQILQIQPPHSQRPGPVRCSPSLSEVCTDLYCSQDQQNYQPSHQHPQRAEPQYNSHVQQQRQQQQHLQQQQPRAMFRSETISSIANINSIQASCPPVVSHQPSRQLNQQQQQAQLSQHQQNQTTFLSSSLTTPTQVNSLSDSYSPQPPQNTMMNQQMPHAYADQRQIYEAQNNMQSIQTPIVQQNTYQSQFSTLDSLLNNQSSPSTLHNIQSRQNTLVDSQILNQLLGNQPYMNNVQSFNRPNPPRQINLPQTQQALLQPQPACHSQQQYQSNCDSNSGTRSYLITPCNSSHPNMGPNINGSSSIAFQENQLRPSNYASQAYIPPPQPYGTTRQRQPRQPRVTIRPQAPGTTSVRPTITTGPNILRQAPRPRSTTVATTQHAPSQMQASQGLNITTSTVPTNNPATPSSSTTTQPSITPIRSTSNTVAVAPMPVNPNLSISQTRTSSASTTAVSVSSTTRPPSATSAQSVEVMSMKQVEKINKACQVNRPRVEMVDRCMTTSVLMEDKDCQTDFAERKIEVKTYVDRACSPITFTSYVKSKFTPKRRKTSSADEPRALSEEEVDVMD